MQQTVNTTIIFFTFSRQGSINLVISLCCFAEDGKELYKDSKLSCTAIVLNILFSDVPAPFAVVAFLNSLMTDEPKRRKHC